MKQGNDLGKSNLLVFVVIKTTGGECSVFRHWRRVLPFLILVLGIVFWTKSFTSRLLFQLRQFTRFLIEFPLQVGAWGRAAGVRRRLDAEAKAGALGRGCGNCGSGGRGDLPAPHPWPWKEPDFKPPTVRHRTGARNGCYAKGGGTSLGVSAGIHTREGPPSPASGPI